MNTLLFVIIRIRREFLVCNNEVVWKFYIPCFEGEEIENIPDICIVRR